MDNRVRNEWEQGVGWAEEGKGGKIGTNRIKIKCFKNKMFWSFKYSLRIQSLRQWVR